MTYQYLVLKRKLGALVYEFPYFIWGMRSSDKELNNIPWVYVKNRNQELIHLNEHIGVKCNWKWTSDLYLPKIYPVFGKWLCKRALKDFPIRLADIPEDVDTSKKPQVSFLIGHRGMDRLPLLLLTLKSIAAQKECAIECIVVEQDNEQQIKEHLPEWVRYIHTPLPDKSMPYSRSWAFNVAAREAHSDCLVFHDNDMLIPEVYANHIFKYLQQGYSFVNIKRFIFYLTNSDTRKVIESDYYSFDCVPEKIVQNLEGGGSIAAGKKMYFDIGGFDERFVGWGGEDNEFWERAQTRKVYPFGYMPIIHLWHEPQHEKVLGNKAATKQLYNELTSQDPMERIQYLRKHQCIK